MIGTLLLIVLIIALFGGGWGYRSGWYGRYGPSGTGYNPAGVLVIVLIILLIIGLVGGPGLGWYTW
jgi:hypothetical protein